MAAGPPKVAVALAVAGKVTPGCQDGYRLN